jgi:hypothetical protein
MKIGMIFEHKKWLDPEMNGRPLRCKITKIARGSIYYRPYYGKHCDGSEWLGSPAFFAVDDAAKYMGAVCDA